MALEEPIGLAPLGEGLEGSAVDDSVDADAAGALRVAQAGRMERAKAAKVAIAARELISLLRVMAGRTCALADWSI
jgi:hypothetical protein